MKILRIQDVFKAKFERQASIPELKYHASGHCVHIGKISPGCYKCFAPCYSKNFHIGSDCNCCCTYCYGGRKGEILNGPSLEEKTRLLKEAIMATISEQDIPTISFTGGGDPLMNLEVITEYMRLFHHLEKDLGKKPWYYLYTNGLLATPETLSILKDLGFNEIRFHLGASNFSKKAYNNLSEAVKYLDTVTVETPSWPPHRKKLFEMLKIINDIGVKHLNIGEIEITQQNQGRIKAALPDAKIYQCWTPHLYDDGLVYDIMEKVVEKKYSFSVLDCSSFVKSIQRTPGKYLAHENLDNLHPEYNN